VALRRFAVSIPFRISVVRPEYRPSSPLADQFVAALRAEAKELLGRLPGAGPVAGSPEPPPDGTEATRR